MGPVSGEDGSPGQRDTSRRRFLQITAGAGVGSVSGCAWFRSPDDHEVYQEVDPPPATPVSHDGWPMYRYDRFNTGHKPNTEGPVNGTTLRWQFDLGRSAASSPAVVNESVYVGGVGGQGAGGHLFAVDAADGTERWRYETNSDVVSSPAVIDDTVYFGEYDGTVHAVDATDGTERWQYFPEGVERPAGLRSSTTVVGNVVYVCHLNLRVLDATTGEEQWSGQSSELTTPAVAGEVVYVGTDDVAPGTKNVLARDGATGDPRWDRKIPGGTTATPAIGDRTLFVKSLDGVVHALDVRTGEQRWTRQIGESHQRLMDASPGVADDTVYVGAETRIHALDASEGDERWQFPTDDEVVSAPAIVNGTVYVGSRDGHVYALNAEDGTERWQFRTEGEVTSAPSVVDGTLYLTCGDGYLYALDD